MKKQIVLALVLSLLLAGCGGKDNNSSEKATESPSETPITSVVPHESTASDGTTETKKEIPYIPGEVLYSDDNHIGVEAPFGGLFIDGNQVESEAFDGMINHFKETSSLPYTTPAHGDTPSNNGTTTTTNKKPATEKTTTTQKEEETAPDFELPEVSETERPTGTIYLEEEDQLLAKYVSSGNTELDISKVSVYSNSRPGVKGIEAFEPGDTLIINIHCNTDKRFDSKLYVVPDIADHKNSYKKNEYLTMTELSLCHVAGEGLLLCELKIPENTPAGVYELRFVCGSEEGYIPFHFGYSK